MSGEMRCLGAGCGLVWDSYWLCRLKAANAASRRALTMAEALVRREICHRVWVGPGEKAPSHMETCPKHRTLAAIKAARTLMREAEGKGTQ